MEFIDINKTNIDAEHICCAIGNDKANKSRALTKKLWLKDRFDEGLVFRRLNERGKVFIEYIPIEYVWKPLIGENYMHINCLWVSGKYKKKGLSIKLLNSCIEDARSRGMNGVSVVSSTKVKPFLTDKRFFLKHDFQTVDKADPYFELLTYKFNSDAPDPSFTDSARLGVCDNKEGFTFIYSNQCPFMEEYIGLLSVAAERKGCFSTAIFLKNPLEAKKWGSPFGTLGIYYRGQFLTHELMTEAKFEDLIDSLN